MLSIQFTVGICCRELDESSLFLTNAGQKVQYRHHHNIQDLLILQTRDIHNHESDKHALYALVPVHMVLLPTEYLLPNPQTS